MIVKLQHYVPRFYLKNFAFCKDREYLVYCLDKSDSRTFPVSVKKIGCEKFFYEQKKEKNNLEKALSKLESDFAKISKKLDKTRALSSLNWKEKEKNASFIAVQEFRTREHREDIRSLGNEMKKRLEQYPLSNDLEQQLKNINSEETARSIQLKLVRATLAGKTGIIQILLNMKWILFENLTKIPLWTSDQPINRFNPIENPLGNLGLTSKGIQIFFPLNPTLELLICDPIEYFTYPEKMSCTKEHVIFSNGLQVKSSTRHVFSKNNDFYLAKKWLKQNPMFANPKRQRVTSIKSKSKTSHHP